jgi:AraC family transcriptional regulator, arabinose operon regulatory protein
MQTTFLLPPLRTEVRIMEPRIYRAIRLMTADLRREISLDELAQSLNLSASRLRHLFKDETGLSPVQYLKAQRMQKARELLETTFLNVKEVMLKVGFTDRSHFVRDFKKACGLAPLQYRNQHLIAQQQKSSHRIVRSATR